MDFETKELLNLKTNQSRLYLMPHFDSPNFCYTSQILSLKRQVWANLRAWENGQEIYKEKVFKCLKKAIRLFDHKFDKNLDQILKKLDCFYIAGNSLRKTEIIKMVEDIK